MKRLILFFSLVLFACCMLAVAVGAEAYTYDFGEVEKLDYFEKYSETHNGTDYVTVVLGEAYITSTTKDARVVLSCTCEKGRHTYPTYYIMQEKKADWLDLFRKDFAPLNNNDHCDVTYGINSILAIEIPDGVRDFWGDNNNGAFKDHTNMVYISIPDTMEDMSYLVFKGCTSLEWINFNNNNKITAIQNSAFNGCTSLKGICLPDSVKYMYNATFIGCSNLGPVHLPENLISFGTDPTWSTFQGGQNGNGSKYTKMFLTNERFDNPDNVEKPKVYYMPSKFQSCGDQLFRGCSNINDVLVFPTTYTAVTDYRSFLGYGATAENPKTVVFLGNMTSFNAWANPTTSYMNYVFANPNDVVGGFEATFTFEGSHDDIIMYSCASGQAGRAYQTVWGTELFKHFANPKTSTEVIKPGNCVEKSTVQGVCFCGHEMGEIEGWTDPSAHEFDVSKSATLLKIIYASFGDYGTRHVKCARCTATHEDKSASPIITTKGYAVKNNSTGIDGGYFIDTDALKEYETLMGEVKIGIVIANADYATNLITIENGEYYLSTTKGLMVEMSSREYSSFSLAIQGFTPESAEKLKLVIASYVIADYDDNDETADTVKYVQHEMPLTESKLIEVNPGIYLDAITLERIKQEAILAEENKQNQ